ncbi:MAG: ImmA/IrrE family metallo-endopeptidase [Methylocystis sp.]
MTDDFIVKGRSDKEVRELARRARDFFQIDRKRVDLDACMRRQTIWTVKGEKPFQFRIMPDEEMGTADGLTVRADNAVEVWIKESVWKLAQLGEGRARNTVAHEIGHAVMHDRAAMPRRANGNKMLSWIKPFESGEHQANVFAPAFLIDDAVADSLSTPEGISVQFGVSLESARIYVEERTEQAKRFESAQKIRRMCEALKSEIRPTESRQQVKFIDVPRPSCGKETMFPVGPKFMCQTCEKVTDAFPDGDLN